VGVGVFNSCFENRDVGLGDNLEGDFFLCYYKVNLLQYTTHIVRDH
jgi:hypothetical protein